MEDLAIRYAQKTDVQVITNNNINMAKETEDKVLDPHQARLGVDSLLHNQDHGFYLLAEIEGRVIAQLMVTFEWSDWRNGQFWWIQSVYVAPTFRKKGVFRKLYRALGDLAHDAEGVCGLRLYAHDTNALAMQTYVSIGMQRTHYLVFEEEFN